MAAVSCGAAADRAEAGNAIVGSQPRDRLGAQPAAAARLSGCRVSAPGTVERARGRWREILLHLGVGESFLSKRAGPCPHCGGRDRFRFDDRGEGWHFCQQCGPGPGIVLLRKLRGWTYAEACSAVDEVIGKDAPVAPAREAPTRPDDVKRAALERLLAGSSDDDLVADYLRSRGLAVTSPVLFGRRFRPYVDGKTPVGRFHAVIGPVLSPAGELVSAQRIYMADLSPRKKLAEVVGTVNGAADRLHDCDDELGVSEGIETGLATFQIFGIPTWAAISANGIKTFEPPVSVRRLHVFADNDSSFTGQAAAFALARRLTNRPDRIEVIVNVPPEPDTDWLDVLAAGGAA